MRAVAILISIVLAIAITTPASAQKCEKNHHQAEGWGSAKLRDYLCREQGLRVSFYRMSEVHAGSWIMAAPGRAVLPVAVPAEPVKNAVYKEIETLFRQFGTKFCWHGWTRVDAPKVFGQGTRSVLATESSELRLTYEPYDMQVRCLTIPHPTHSSSSIYLKAPNKIIRTTDRWPKDFNHYYNCHGLEAEYLACCTSIWRYVRPSDFDTIDRDMREWLAKVEEELLKSDNANESGDLDWRLANMADYERHFSLFRHLSKRGWPSDFLVIKGDDQQCGGFFQFRYFPRPLILDLVVIENISQKTVLIDDLVGSKSANENFRAVETSDALRRERPKALGYKKLKLEPGAGIAVPLRIVFVDGTGQETDAEYHGDGSPAPWREAAEARKAFERIQSLPPRAILECNATAGENPSINYVNRKRRESFLPPTLPKVSKYVYGPEIAVAGFVTGGKSISFEGHSANYIAFTAQPADASCPVLYAWNDSTRAWINLGKVIEEAQESKNEATEVVAVEPFTSRFRLAEEEPEVSYIDKVQLNLRLRDGRRLSLSPRKPQLVEADGQYLRILAYTSVDIQFEMPTQISSSDIEKSTLEITGYYRRYSSIFAAAHARASSRIPLKASGENSAAAIPK